MSPSVALLYVWRQSKGAGAIKKPKPNEPGTGGSGDDDGKEEVRMGRAQSPLQHL